MAAREVTLIGLPQLTEISTFWMRASAMFSAAATQSRIDSSASAMPVTVPARRPWLSRKAAPSTRSAPGSARAIRQTTFDEPMSSAATSPGAISRYLASGPEPHRLSHQIALPRSIFLSFCSPDLA